ncbi:hypothetical protein ACOKFD_06280 [Flagellimonas sp. S174]|uniref:hypothetical protein n=1 Tax=Flagellimonas sp. S174 TaxID=3410790 RepID=UPI003BF5DF47
MAQDLKELFEKERNERKYSMKSGHEARFMERLEKDLSAHRKKNNQFWFSAAASVAILIGLGIYFLLQPGKIEPNPQKNVVDTNSEKENVIPISLGIFLPI